MFADRLCMQLVGDGLLSFDFGLCIIVNCSLTGIYFGDRILAEEALYRTSAWPRGNCSHGYACVRAQT